MIDRSLLLVAVGAGLLAGPVVSMAETHLYTDRSAWAAQETVVGTETHDGYVWNQPGGNLLVWGGSHTLGKLRYQVPADSALYGVWSAITQDAPYLTEGNYLQWQSATAGPSTLTINLPNPVASFGFDIGQLYGDSGPFIVTLGNGDTFNLATHADSYRFIGFVSDEPFTSLSISASQFPLIDNLQWRGGRRSDPDPAAGRLAFNPDGIGHILIVPYFSAQGGNATLLNIVNTDEVRGKAVKIRFRGASNADSVFNFQIFLTPGDAWTANISRGASGLSRMLTADKSCTLPADINRDFVTTRLNTTLAADELASETREGYVEIITMGDIVSSSDPASLWNAIAHDAVGAAPCTTSVLESLTVADPRLAPPTTGLMANWVIINVPNATLWSGDAPAIETRFNGVAGEGRNVYWPQTATALTEEQRDANTADPLFRYGAVAATSRDLPDLSTPYIPTSAAPIVQATALSDALATTQFAVEYLTDPGINASTDWVFSAPTRRYYAAVDYAAAAFEEQLITNHDNFGIELADYFTSRYANESGNLVMGNVVNGGRPWQACLMLTRARYWNREGWVVHPTPPVIPAPPQPPGFLCGATSALGVGLHHSPIGASIARTTATLPASVVDGWSAVSVLNTFDGANLGLPLLVIQFSKATNPSVSPGVSGTFGAAWRARATQRGAFFVP